MRELIFSTCFGLLGCGGGIEGVLEAGCERIEECFPDENPSIAECVHDGLDYRDGLPEGLQAEYDREIQFCLQSEDCSTFGDCLTQLP